MKTYNGLRQLQTFEERFEYLKFNSVVGEMTFGYERYLNQMFYNSREWKYTRHQVILRDNGCDLGIEGRELNDRIVIHHIEPITMDDIEKSEDCIFDLNNLITTGLMTHNAIHYGNFELIPRLPEERTLNDTCPWLK